MAYWQVKGCGSDQKLGFKLKSYGISNCLEKRMETKGKEFSHHHRYGGGALGFDIRHRIHEWFYGQLFKQCAQI